MQHTMKQLAGATLVAAMALAGTAHAQQVENVKIGFAGPMTGAQAHYGKDFQNGVTLAVEEMNATKPVIGGHPVHFVLDSADDQADPRTGTTANRFGSPSSSRSATARVCKCRCSQIARLSVSKAALVIWAMNRPSSRFTPRRM